MSQLKQIISNSLRIKDVPEKVIDSVDTLINRSFLRLSKSDVLPARSWEFTSSVEKNAKVLGEQTIEYYLLPDDFRSLDEFYVYDTKPYFWVENDQHILKQIAEDDTDDDDQQRKFTITHENFTDQSKSQRWLIAYPFPDDDKTVRIRYYSNGKCDDYSWLDSTYWEMVISEVESILGLVSREEAEEHKSEAIRSVKEVKGTGSGQGFTRLASTYFGGIRYRDKPKERRERI